MQKECWATSRSSLTGYADDIVAKFDSGLEHLACLRGSASDLDATVSALLGLTGNGASETDLSEAPLAVFLELAARTADQADTIAGMLSNNAFDMALNRLVEDLSQLERGAMELRSICYITKIVGPEIHDARRQIAAFVKTLEEQSEELRAMAKHASSMLSSIQTASGGAAMTLKGMNATFKSILASVEGDVSDLTALHSAHMDHIASIEIRTRKIGDDVNRAVSKLIPCMQFPDAFSQRAEHVATMLDALQSVQEPEKRDVIEHIVSAQVLSMSKSIDETTGQALNTLQRVLHDLQDGAQQKEEWSINPSARWISAARDSNKTMQQVAEVGRKSLDEALAIIGTVACKIDSAIQHLEQSAELNLRLEVAACNATVSAARFGSNRSPLKVIATSVKDAMEKNALITKNLAQGLESVRSVALKLREASLENDLNALADIQRNAEAAATEQTAMTATLDRLRQEIDGHAKTIRNAASMASLAFHGAGADAPQLAVIFSKSEAELDKDLIAGMDLTWIEKIYTMEEERSIHRDLCGTLSSSLVSGAVDLQDPDEELDEFLL